MQNDFRSLLFRCVGLLFLCVSYESHANFYEGKWHFHLGPKTHIFDLKSSTRGSPMLDVLELAKYFQFNFEENASRTSYVLTNPRNAKMVKFSSLNRRIQGFWGVSTFSKKPKRDAKALFVPLDFGDRVLRPLLTGEGPGIAIPRALPFAADIVIDPGHGGNDYGAIVNEGNFTYLEKDIVLKLGMQLKASLEKAGLKVLLTRESDVYLALPERTAFANRNRARLFLSLHLNSSPSHKARGFEVYILSLKDQDGHEALKTISIENMQIPDDLEGGVEKAVAELRAQAHFENSLEWAKWVSQALTASIPSATERSVRQGPFYLLYGASMPSLLVEFGYLDNKIDRDLFANFGVRQKFLESLSQTLIAKLKSVKEKK